MQLGKLKKMSNNKYYYENQQKKTLNRMEIHPIWRGIGFVFLIITPVIAYYCGIFLLEENGKNGWVNIPADVIAYGNSDPYIYIKIFLIIVFMVLLYGIYAFITFLIFSLFGPKRYGPYDVPNVSYRGKKHSR